jgi:peroxiredoxin family protein
MSSLVIFLHSSSYDRLFQAANLLLTASSMGQKCDLFLFYGALATFVDGSWDDVGLAPGAGSPDWARTLERSFGLADTPSLYDIIDMAKKERGGLTVCACSTSMKMLGLDPAAVKAARGGVDEIVGHATMLEIAAQTNQVLYI